MLFKKKRPAVQFITYDSIPKNGIYLHAKHFKDVSWLQVEIQTDKSFAVDRSSISSLVPSKEISTTLRRDLGMVYKGVSTNSTKRYI